MIGRPYMPIEEEKRDELRPVVHQHMSMLTSAGVNPTQALAIAAHVCALVYSITFDEALAEAFASIDDNAGTPKSDGA